jgi:hypothetical protein
MSSYTDWFEQGWIKLNTNPEKHINEYLARYFAG